MSTLAARQSAFMASLLDDERALPEGWTARHAAGLDIYRNNYRSALVEALRSTFERTERLVGEASFARAAAHHLIMHPPSSWTLDLAGAGFAETCEDLFPADPEVAELAWLGWSMHLAFVARDANALSSEGFLQLAADFTEEDWGDLRLVFMPGLTQSDTTHDLKRLWSSLATTGSSPDIVPVSEASTTIVWREGERPVFISVSQAEGRALAAMMDGASYGEACEALVEQEGPAGIELAGTMLRRWLFEGMVEAVA
ncbi:DNA-binding domain-containing protein [Qipengyuania gelatinilytica]|uniref:DNA-binding domain-containing protein n=1 Tax=Qipengyuania gelatinilytica TaxID=2867231 RepID=A0ABX8ZZM2_9SPHN|nr:DNA-binding domain-containing protein [Qipengyuania gelatinilytica]QZD94475.1 DNA-binding domain-containing protein [Qipengyuania gelatinilytica]